MFLGTVHTSQMVHVGSIFTFSCFFLSIWSIGGIMRGIRADLENLLNNWVAASRWFRRGQILAILEGNTPEHNWSEIYQGITGVAEESVNMRNATLIRELTQQPFDSKIESLFKIYLRIHTKFTFLKFSKKRTFTITPKLFALSHKLFL